MSEDDIDNRTLQFLADTYRKATIHLDREDYNKEEVEEKFYAYLSNEDYEKIRELAEEQEEKHGIDLNEIKNFVEMLESDDTIETSDNEEIRGALSQGTLQAIKTQITERDKDEMVVRTPETVSIANIFHLQEELYEQTGKKAFLISDQRSWDGRISVELSPTKEKFQLLKIYETDEGYEFLHFGESASKYKGRNVEDVHNQGFFVYKFVADATEYLLFSTEKLSPMSCEVKGTHYKLNDYKEVGENAGLPVNQDIIFCHSVEPAIEAMSAEEVRDFAEGEDHDWFASKLFGDVRQPQWYEKLFLAMLSVNEDYGYPSGLIEMAEAGTGKSWRLEALARAIDESQGVHTGSGGTVKGLIPSFKDSPPDEGYLLKTRRIACVDEVFNLLSSARDGSNQNMKDTFRPLLDLIEHQDRTFSSGNGSIRAKMEGMAYMAGNPSYGVGSIMEAADKLDQAFLSRFILYDQLDTHIQFIENRKFEVDKPKEEMMPEVDHDFISMLDFFRNDLRVKVNGRRIQRVKDDLRDKVPSNFESIYRARYDHHMKNVAAGLAKVNSLIEERDEFEVRDRDYAEMREIFEVVISSWSRTADLENLSVQARPYYLPHEQRKVYEEIRDNPGVETSNLDVEVDSLSWCLTELRKIDVIYENDNRYYPYFSDEGKTEKEKKFPALKS